MLNLKLKYVSFVVGCVVLILSESIIIVLVSDVNCVIIIV